MKQKIKGIAMIADQVDANGNVFTAEALREAVLNFKSCGIGYEFNPHIPHFGKVTKVELVDGKLVIEGEVDTAPFVEQLAVVPVFNVKKMHSEGITRVIDEAEIIEMSLTSQPADKEATRYEL